MKKTKVKLTSLLLVLVMLFPMMPTGSYAAAGPEEKSDYSVSPDFAARYPNGVLEFSEAEAEIAEGGRAVLKLVREGGTQGKISVVLKAIDVTAKYGVDYYVLADGKKLKLDDEYAGTLTENYLEENGVDYIMPDEVTTDEVYRQIIGYEEPELDDETTAELYGTSVGLVSDTLNISPDKVQELLGLNEEDELGAAAAADTENGEDKAYASALHAQKDAILGKQTAANHMDGTDLIDEDALLGSNEQNIAASEIYGAAVGASVVVTFKEGENEIEIVVVTKNDKNYEPQEICSLGICEPTGGAQIGSLLNVAVKIDNDDPVAESTIGFETDAVTVGSDENAAAVDIVRTGSLNDYAVANVSTRSVSAVEGYDYLPISTQSVFLPGEAKKTVIVPLKTSVNDQDVAKTVKLDLTCETAGVSTDIAETTIRIEPKRTYDAKRLNAANGDDKYYIEVTQEEISAWRTRSGNEKGPVTLFYGSDISLEMLEYAEVDVEFSSDEEDGEYLVVRYDKYPEVTDWTLSSSELELNKTFSYTEFKQVWQASGTIKLTFGAPIWNLNSSSIGIYRIPQSQTRTDQVSWDDIQIRSVRLYPVCYKLYQPSDPVTSTWRVFDGVGADNIIQTQTYNAGKISVPAYIYRDSTFEATGVSLSDEAGNRHVHLQGFDLTAIDSSSKKAVGSLKGIGSGTKITAEKMAGWIGSRSALACYVNADPLLLGDPVDHITVAKYDQTMGHLKIGSTEYCDQKVASSAWREGDELKLYVEAMHGYLCDQIEITRSDGKKEYCRPGDSVMLTKGMTVRPVLKQENITATVHWAGLLPGSEGEAKATNLSHKYTVSSASPYEYAKDANGNVIKDTLIFKNLAHGDSVTLYAVPADDAPAKYTGMWLREKVTAEEKSLSNDTRFFCCVGDGYTFTVDDHDMTFDYYFAQAENVSGATVTGRVFSPGGSVKKRNNTQLTADNVTTAGKPVANASVAVVSLDANEAYEENGVYYYTDAVTDQNGRFTVYLPTGSAGYGYTITVTDNGRVYNYVTAYSVQGETIFILPFQNENYQIVDMTLGQDHDTTEIAVGTSTVTIGVKVTIAEGYRAQGLVFRSYDTEGTLFKQWSAVSGGGEWAYRSQIKTGDYLVPGGKLTVELIGADGVGQGEVDTGYELKLQPVPKNIDLPKFDPDQSVSLPVFGEYSSKFNLGSASSVTPEEEEKDLSSLSGGSGDKHELTISYGADKALKNALKAAKQTNGYTDMDAKARASLILSKISISDKDLENIKEFKSESRAGKGKNQLGFDYKLGVYMSMYSQADRVYFEDLVLYATIKASAETTQQFTIAGIPVYIKFEGELSGSLLFHVDNKTGQSYLIDVAKYGYFKEDMLKDLQSAGAFSMTVSVTLGLGLGNPKVLSAGLSGTIEFNMDFQPWTDAAGIVGLSLDFGVNIIGAKIKYNIAKTSYGVFRTKGYTGTLDFSKVKNSEKFKSSGEDPVRRSAKKLLRSYDDGENVTEIYGEMITGERGSSVMEQGSMRPGGGMLGAANAVIAQKTWKNASDNTDPLLLPIKNGSAALYLRLDDDKARGDRDYASVAYSVIGFDGTETGPFYLEGDGTFDSDLTAAQIGGGKILVVWRDLSASYGSDQVDFGEALNRADLSYCIFDADGKPGEVKKLTDADGCDGMPTIAYDAATDRTAIVYTSTDYQTEGVTFSEENMEDLGDFLYNSYSTVCFKMLDENGNIIDSYTAAESNYTDYEASNGSLGGMRYLDVQLDDKTSQATIDEMSAAARGGKLYVVYSIDTDWSVHTNEDRELYTTVVDLDTMEQSGPVKLTTDSGVDANPQLVDYNEKMLLFWNDDGTIRYADLEEYLAASAGTEKDAVSLADLDKKIEDAPNTAESFHARVQPSGSLTLIWTGSQEIDDRLRPAIFFKEYDPQFKVTRLNEEGEEYFTYGAWGKPQTLADLVDGTDCTEFRYLDCGARSLFCYNRINKDGEDHIVSHDMYLQVLGRKTSVAVNAEILPEYPLAGEHAILSVDVTNTGSLPADSVTVQVDLIDKDGNTTELGAETFEEDYRSKGMASLTIDDLVMPEDFDRCKLRVVAWEDDLKTTAAVERISFPYESSVSFDDVELTEEDDGYVLAFTVKNDGNKDFEGTVELDRIADDLDVLGDSETFTPVTEDLKISVAAKEEARKVIFFDVDEDDLNEEDDSCKLYLSVTDGENFCDERTFYLTKTYEELPDVKDVRFGDAEEIDALELAAGEETTLNALIMPYKARNGYHLEYSVDDPKVARVDASGNVTALAGGQANITVSVVRDNIAMIVGADSLACGDDGKEIAADEYGKVDLAAGEETVVMTKTVSVRVNGQAQEVTTQEGQTEEDLTQAQRSFTIGDVDMDGKIRAKDARLALRAAAKLETLDEISVLLADVNEDGRVKSNDARAILRISAKVEPTPERKIAVPA